MTTDQQVRLLMSLIKSGLSLPAAAAKAGMSERTARKYRRAGKLPSQLGVAHTWRTRADPFEAVWPEIETLLEQDAGLEAKTVFEELGRRYPGRFSAGQLRTLQRRCRDWRALRGEKREVFFSQHHHPAEQSQSDFTDMRLLAVTLSGTPFQHLLYHFVLTYSNWESVTVCHSETFEALSEGLQEALWRLGGVPQEHRTDNLSAATHDLPKHRGRDFTRRYRELLEHYGLRGSTNTPGRAHENGDVESSHGAFKRALDQRLRLRGSRDFQSVEAYRAWVEAFVGERNATRWERVAEERKALRALPARALATYREESLTVKRGSIIRVAGKVYSMPSRLIGHRVQVRLHANHLEVYYGGVLVARPERVRGAGLEGHRLPPRGALAGQEAGCLPALRVPRSHVPHAGLPPCLRRPGRALREVGRPGVCAHPASRSHDDAMRGGGGVKGPAGFRRAAGTRRGPGSRYAKAPLAVPAGAGRDARPGYL